MQSDTSHVDSTVLSQVLTSPTPWNEAPSLDQIVNEIWTELQAGVTSGKHPFHLPVLGTVDAAGWPQLRTVVLRGADPERLRLLCHCDRRSPKVDQVRTQPCVTWLFYDPQAKVQLRVRAWAEVLADDPEADRRWLATTIRSRRCYLAPRAPGTKSVDPTSNLPEDLRDNDPEPARSEQGRDRFAVIAARVREIDWLCLDGSGHLRALFRWDASGRREQVWLAP